MESILPSSQSVSDLQGPRFLDPPSAKSPHIQAMETRPDHLLQSSRHGLRTRHCSESRLPWFELVAGQYGLLQYRLARSVFRCDRSASSRITSTFRTAWCGPACQVVWEGSAHAAPIPIGRSTISTTRDCFILSSAHQPRFGIQGNTGAKLKRGAKGS